MDNQKPANQLRFLNRLYSIIFFSYIIFLILSSLVVSNAGPLLQEDPGLFTIIKSIAIGFPIILIPIAYTWPQRKIKAIDESSPLEEKMIFYRKALSLRLLLILVVALAVSFIFMLIGDTNLIMVLAIVLLFLVLSRPTPFKVATDLGLSDQEKLELMK